MQVFDELQRFESLKTSQVLNSKDGFIFAATLFYLHIDQLWCGIIIDISELVLPIFHVNFI